MSFIKARGEQAAEQAVKEKASYEKLLKTMKSGSSYRVRIASANDFAMYESHGVFGKGGSGIFTTPCVHGNDCPYCKAVKEMYEEYNTTKDEEVKGTAGQLKKKERYLLGFVNLADNSPIILDFSKKQAAQITQAIKKYGKKIEKYAFEISKSGSGQATIVSLDIIVDEDDLTEEERKNFTASKGFSFQDEHFEVLQVKTIEESLEDLAKFGFDISRISEKV
jgi:hypothetical protein